MVERFPVAGHLGAHRPLELSYVPSVHYTGGGPQAMADGRRGSLDFRDGAWQAVQGQDMMVTVDLGEPRALEKVQVQCYLYQDAWIFLPRKSVGRCPKTAIILTFWQAPNPTMFWRPTGQTVVPLLWKEGGAGSVCPVDHGERRACPQHDAATEPSWLFADELVLLGR